MPRLGVNIDHVATLREARHGIEPEPVYAALLCQAAGADSIVAHLREDRRHIKERDLYILREVIKVKLNLEMSLAEEIIEIASKVKPQQITLVPEKRQELTTEGGLDVKANLKKVSLALDRFSRQRIEVSLFIDPDKSQIEASRKIGIKFIELHTGKYAQADNTRKDKYFKEIESAAYYADGKGIKVFAGHGLNYYNTAGITRIKCIEELNIGHSIICRAVMVGLERAVKEMKALMASSQLTN